MDTNSTVKERLKMFVQYLGMSEREFCRELGVGSAYICSIKKSIKADKLKRLTDAYPRLNPIWLMRGEGEMLLPDDLTNKPGNEPSPSEMLLQLLEDARGEKARLLGIIESQQRTIEYLTEQNRTKQSILEKVAKVIEVG